MDKELLEFLQGFKASVEEKFDNIDKRFGEVRKDIREIKEDMTGMSMQLEGLDKKIDKVAQNQVTLENKIDNKLKAHDDKLDIHTKDIEELKKKVG